MDMDRSSNGEYKYQRDDDADDKPRSLDESEEKDDQQVDKAGEYMHELLQEKIDLDAQKWPNAIRLLDQEIQKTETMRRPMRESKYVDIYREKHVRVSVKVLIPIREHPKFNFVGKLLGPKGNSMKRLQEETMCKMAVLGRGSMKDKQKEEELRASLNLKYAHLSDDLHVEITAIAPPAEAYARIAFALAEVRKYLIPDNNDNIRQEQMREMEMTMTDDPVSNDRRGPSMRGPSNLGVGNVPRPAARQALPRGTSRAILPPPPVNRGPPNRPAPSKSKVFSILDRARAAMDQSYNYDTQTPPPANRTGSHHDYDYHGSSGSNARYGDRYPSNSGYTTYEYDDDSAPHSSRDYYESSDYPEDSSSRAWKSYKTTTTSGAASRYRTTPYTRPSNVVTNPLVANLPNARRPMMPTMQKPVNERNRP
ncbi:KH domain-containing, RNA-binding, signal transduction-associated protein 3-like isoform X1 [Temnothorax curvispinosus]|uniref:KH domain-containing, RNA-binding, signal transduction-associated protein 3-like isoform X1 n=1 Tax=Temnothorax curvispinosus TaxID=300111 RepID=A0A6J1QRT9_9HYME|nr:KH domain-containing, RNA-binding, signal transduction-associated protein 3-like isoform X1 [Temnothorax curvispinosus]XP_024884632.1 KH domain-containing, RNA-binding, signal transduction-associated protein 3-like isoform X1 [Temnothorax curvispinosus]XP_024884633.1 KH domain-containing, RNA-binding, signal transduction-associated protein 3-like isoform X1 [Temnothorax curvispinosus]XP_024884634.1 KH domain-containing, RNA-binding, signal transduction-associated protein 3-like isoform X1 [Te